MSAYTIALFFHVISAIGFFLDAGLWLLGLAVLRRAQRVEQVRTILTLTARTGPLAGISLLVLLASGIYMTITGWSFDQGWIRVGMFSLLLLFALGVGVIEPRRRGIIRLANASPDGSVSEALAGRTQAKLLSLALYVQLALLLGVVFLMTNKPAISGALIVMAVALGLGLVVGWLIARTAHPKAQQAAAGTSQS